MVDILFFFSLINQGNAHSGLPHGMGGPPDGEKDKDPKDKDVWPFQKLLWDLTDT